MSKISRKVSKYFLESDEPVSATSETDTFGPHRPRGEGGNETEEQHFSFTSEEAEEFLAVTPSEEVSESDIEPNDEDE